MPDTINTPLAIVGSGMAGIGAAAFALEKGISFVQAGRPSELSFSSGCLDLLGRIPGTPGRAVQTPFKAIQDLVSQHPGHPYAIAGPDHIRKGFSGFTAFMERIGLPYHMDPDFNQYIITPAGTLKPTYAVPLSMLAASRAIKKSQRILIADIRGLKGFGARQMAMTLERQVPGIQAVTIEFPGREKAGDLMCERLTWDLENPRILDQFAQNLARHTRKVDVLGLPAILGIYRFEELRQKIEDIVKARVFEIPTLAPSVTGMRLKEAFMSKLSDLGISHFSSRLSNIEVDKNEKFVFKVTQGMTESKIRASHLVLATGRFMGRGLGVKDERIRETLFGLPVIQPDLRNQWFEQDFFSPKGHRINRAGVQTDKQFRPLDKTGKIFHPNLYAVGSILAHQDWKREKSGAGISIASAHKALSVIAETLGLG